MIGIKNNKVDAKELHKLLKVKKHFATWIRQKIKDADLQIDKDFYPRKGKSTGGRPTFDYQLTIEAAKEICLLQQTPEAHKLRRELIDISQKVENLEYLSIPQIAFCMKLIEVLRYISNQKKARELHQEVWLQNNVNDKEGKYVYALFNNYRNSLTGLNNNDIETACKQWCVENNRAMPKEKSRSNLLIFFDKYETVREAVIDILSVKGEDEEKIKNIAATVKKLCKESGVNLHRANENNLYQEKQITGTIQQLIKS